MRRSAPQAAGHKAEEKAARFLAARGLAIVASRGAQKQVETIRRTQEGKRIRDLDHAKEVAGELRKLTFTVKAKAAGDSGRLFGSITPGDIVDAVRAAGGPALDKRAVEVPGQIKTVGNHPVTVRLHPEVTTQVEIAVVAS